MARPMPRRPPVTMARFDVSSRSMTRPPLSAGPVSGRVSGPVSGPVFSG